MSPAAPLEEGHFIGQSVPFDDIFMPAICSDFSIFIDSFPSPASIFSAFIAFIFFADIFFDEVFIIESSCFIIVSFIIIESFAMLWACPIVGSAMNAAARTSSLYFIINPLE